jgi:hypothetical protein
VFWLQGTKSLSIVFVRLFVLCFFFLFFFHVLLQELMELSVSDVPRSSRLVVRRCAGNKKPHTKDEMFPSCSDRVRNNLVLAVGICFYNEDAMELRRTLKSLKAQEEALGDLNTMMEVNRKKQVKTRWLIV